MFPPKGWACCPQGPSTVESVPGSQAEWSAGLRVGGLKVDAPCLPTSPPGDSIRPVAA